MGRSFCFRCRKGYSNVTVCPKCGASLKLRPSNRAESRAIIDAFRPGFKPSRPKESGQCMNLDTED